MPMTEKGSKIKSAMQQKYGAKKGEKVFYASKNKGTIKGVEKKGYNHGTYHSSRDPEASGKS
jgi:hypothetical protein